MRNTRIVLARRARIAGQAVIAAAAMLTALLVSVQPGQATPIGLACAAEQRTPDFHERLNLAVAQLRFEGKSQADVDRVLASKYRMKLLTKRSTDAESVATEDDISIQAVSTKDDVTVNKPSIYRDTCTGAYNVFATYKWKTMSRFRSERPFFCNNPCALSGDDGFGVAFNRQVAIAGGNSMTRWGNNGHYPPASVPRELNGNQGAVFTNVDHICLACWGTNDAYSWYNGQIVYTINSLGCGPLQAVGSYSHTWTNVDITGVSIGHLTVGFTWSQNTHRWKAASDNSNAVQVC